MNIAFCFGLVFVTLVRSVGLQEQNAARAGYAAAKEQLGALESLESKVRHKITMAINRETGTPRHLSGGLTINGYRLKAEPYDASALRFISENRKLFGILNPSEELKFIDKKTEKSGFNHVLFNRVYKGIRVEGSQLAVHFDPADDISSINGVYFPSFDTPVIPTIKKEEAIGVIKQDLSVKDVQLGVQELIILVSGSEPKLCWKIQVRTSQYPRLRYTISAMDGTIIIKDTGIIH